MNHKGSILIVDDNPQNLQVLGSLLQKEGHSISVAMNGPDAIAFLADHAVDLVLLDVMMPGMSGFEACEKLKANPHTKDIPVIFVSARIETQDIVRGFEAGGVDYVTKPFNPPELLARVRTHVALQKARSEIVGLRSILPICSSCKKIRDDDGYWQQVEEYVSSHADVRFSHGICHDCMRKLYPDIADRQGPS